MSTVYQIPLLPGVRQTFNITLGGNDYVLTLLHRSVSALTAVSAAIAVFTADSTIITADSILALADFAVGNPSAVSGADVSEGWVLDIADVNGNPILTGIPLVTGADLLAQYPHLEFGGQLFVQTSSDPDAVPTFDNLGTDGQLYWVVTP